MVYPVKCHNLTMQEIVEVIVASEASILQGLNKVYCEDFVNGIIDEECLSSKEKLDLMANVLNIMASKECTVANILESSADLLVIENCLVYPVCDKEYDCSYCH